MASLAAAPHVNVIANVTPLRQPENIAPLVVGFVFLLVVPPFIAAYVTFARSCKSTRHGQNSQLASSMLPLHDVTAHTDKSGKPNFSRPLQLERDCFNLQRDQNTNFTSNEATSYNVLPASPICSDSATLIETDRSSPLDPRSHWRTSHPFFIQHMNASIQPHVVAHWDKSRVTEAGIDETQVIEIGISRHCLYHSTTATRNTTRLSAHISNQQSNIKINEKDVESTDHTNHVEYSGTHKQDTVSLSPIIENPNEQLTPPTKLAFSTSFITSHQDSTKTGIARRDSSLLGNCSLPLPQHPAPALKTTGWSIYKHPQSTSRVINEDLFFGTARSTRLSRDTVKLLQVRAGRADINKSKLEDLNDIACSHHKSVAIEVGNCGN